MARMDSRNARRMMQRMGMQMQELSGVTRVIIQSPGKEIVIEQPTVTSINVQGQKMYQVLGGKTVERAPQTAIAQGAASRLRRSPRCRSPRRTCSSSPSRLRYPWRRRVRPSSSATATSPGPSSCSRRVRGFAVALRVRQQRGVVVEYKGSGVVFDPTGNGHGYPVFVSHAHADHAAAFKYPEKAEVRYRGDPPAPPLPRLEAPRQLAAGSSWAIKSR